MIDEPEIHRMIGANSARITILERSRESVERELRTSLRDINENIAQLKSSIDSSRGGWKAIAWFVGALLTAMGLAITMYHTGVLH